MNKERKKKGSHLIPRMNKERKKGPIKLKRACGHLIPFQSNKKKNNTPEKLNASAG
jgi:hypothetical protein